MKKRKWWIYLILFLLLALLVIFIKIKTAKVVETVVVSFDSDGGSSVEFQIIKKGDAASEPKSPEKEGATFDRWMLGEKPYEFGAPVNESITLKASWIADKEEEEKDEEEDEKKEEEQKEEQSSETAPPAPPAEEYEDYGLVVNVTSIVNGPIYSFGANHPNILGTLKAAVRYGIAVGEIVGISVTYPDGTVINTGFVVWTTDVTAMGNIYLPEARRVLIKGFCEGMQVGLWIKHPDGTEFSDGFTVTGGDIPLLESIASGY